MGFFRTMSERLSRGHTFKRHINVRGELLPLIVSPDAQLKYLKFGVGAFDQDLIEIAETYLNDESHVWDIGANVGVFTFAAAHIATKGEVVSIEPDIWLTSILRRTAGFKLYSRCNISIVPVAISNQNSISSFMIAKRGRASNALEDAGGSSQMGGVRQREYVPTVTLDQMLKVFSAPSFVKIDIEGAELMAVEGGTQLIEEVRPLFYIEVGQNVSEQMLSIFHDADYIATSEKGEVLDTSCTANTFFIPREKYHAS